MESCVSIPSRITRKYPAPYGAIVPRTNKTRSYLYRTWHFQGDRVEVDYFLCRHLFNSYRMVTLEFTNMYILPYCRLCTKINPINIKCRNISPRCRFIYVYFLEAYLSCESIHYFGFPFSLC